MKRAVSCILAMFIMTTGSLLQAQDREVEPALGSPFSEQPGEPGDFARMFEALVPRSDLRYTKKTIQVLDTEIAYVDEGKGNAIIFIHGAPESTKLI